MGEFLLNTVSIKTQVLLAIGMFSLAVPETLIKEVPEMLELKSVIEVYASSIITLFEKRSCY